MAKNNKLINSIKAIAKRKEADNIQKAEQIMTPHVYAALALALYQRGWRHKRINQLFNESEAIWEAYKEWGGEESMVQVCHDLTGILLLNEEQAAARKENE